MKKFLILLCLALCSVLPAAARIAATGENAPEIQSPVWLDGKHRKISDFRNKKYTVLFIWDLDQKAIIAIPAMIDAAKRCNSDTTGILSVASGTPEMIRKFPGASHLPFPVCADHKRATAKLYLRKYDRTPVAVIIGKDGKINWRGEPKQVPAVLSLIAQGKFDLNERIRQENFSNALSTAIRSKNFDQALKLAGEEWKRKPENVDLLSMQMIILCRHLKKVDAAYALLAEARKKLPDSRALDELELQLIRNTGKYELLDGYVSRMVKKYQARPDLMLHFTDLFSRLPQDKLNPMHIYTFFRAGWKSGKFKNNAARGRYALQYAMMMQSFGRTDQAYKLAVLASGLLKGQKGHSSAIAAAAAYKKLLEIAPKLEI